MKKILMSLFVLGLFAFSFQAHASVISDALLKIENLTKEITQLKSQLKASVGDIALAGTSTNDTTPRIMFWPGAVNQHVDSDGVWQTDPDGKSGGWPSTQYPNDFGGREVEYCNKFYSNITSVEAYKNETINTWYNAGNIKTSTGTRMSYKCVSEKTTTPTITVLSPNSGKEAIESGQKVEIRWDSNVSTNALVDVYVSDGTHKGKSVRTSNNGEAGLIYTLDSSLTPGSNYKACISLVSETPASDCSDYPFIIKSASVVETTPSIKILSPNGWESYTPGKTYDITWKSTDVNNVSIYLIKKGASDVTEMITGSSTVSASTGKYSWTIPTTNNDINSGGQFKVVIYDGDSSIKDSSDTYFTINPTTTANSSIKVISPNGGEIYKVGDKITVKWNSSNYSSSNLVMISIRSSLLGEEYEMVTIKNDGVETILIPSTFDGPDGKKVDSGNYYKIAVSLAGSPTLKDYSDKTFTINSTTEVDSTLKYTSTGDTTPRIMFWPGAVNQHVDSKGNWQTDPDGKSGGWSSKQYPNDYGDKPVEYCNKFYSGITKVEEYKNETISTWYNAGNVKTSKGTRMSYKCIAEKTTTPSITVLSPNGGENYNAGDKINVKWKAENISVPSSVTVEFVNIDTNESILWGDATTSNESINVAAPSNSWKNIKIRLTVINSKEGGVLAKDLSDNYFTINSAVSKTCVPGNSTGQIKISLTSDNPVSTTFSSNVKNINLLNIKLSNEGKQDVCLNGIQLGSSYNPDDFITNTKVVDDSGSQVGKIAYSFSYNNEYYYNWIYPNSPISIPAGKDVVFKIFSDIKEKAIDGSFNMGVWGLNFVSPGSTQYPQTVNGNTMYIRNIVPQTPSIKVISPNGGENYKVGDKIKISVSNGLNGVRVGFVYPDFNPKNKISDGNDVYWLSVSSDAGKILVWDGSSFIDVNGNKNYWSAGTGNYKILAIRDINDSKCYKYKISDCIFDISDDYFTINSTDKTSSSITVLSPNGGESYKAGDKMNIKWVSALSDMGGYAGGFKIRILIKSGDSIFKDVTTADDGQESIEIPSLANGNYTLEIGSTYDSSGGSHYTKYNTVQFIINNSTTPLVSSTTSAGTTTTRTLKVGVKGDDVKALQTLLGIIADGSFGPATKAKVIEWQKANNLKADGAFGSVSRLKAGLTE